MKYRIVLTLYTVLVQGQVNRNFRLVLNEMGPDLTSRAWYFHSPAFHEANLPVLRDLKVQMDIFSSCYKRERSAVVHLTSNQSLLQASCIIYNLKCTVFEVHVITLFII